MNPPTHSSIERSHVGQERDILALVRFCRSGASAPSSIHGSCPIYAVGEDSDAQCLSIPVAVAELLSKVAGMAMGRPRAFSVRAMSSLSIVSRVARVSSSTSAGVRPLVGMGSSTGCYLSARENVDNARRWVMKHGCSVFLRPRYIPLIGMLPDRKTKFLIYKTWL